MCPWPWGSVVWRADPLLGFGKQKLSVLRYSNPAVFPTMSSFFGPCWRCAPLLKIWVVFISSRFSCKGCKVSLDSYILKPIGVARNSMSFSLTVINFSASSVGSLLTQRFPRHSVQSGFRVLQTHRSGVSSSFSSLSLPESMSPLELLCP